jgi:hypothetical protein
VGEADPIEADAVADGPAARLGGAAAEGAGVPVALEHAATTNVSSAAAKGNRSTSGDDMRRGWTGPRIPANGRAPTRSPCLLRPIGNTARWVSAPAHDHAPRPDDHGIGMTRRRRPRRGATGGFPVDIMSDARRLATVGTFFIVAGWVFLIYSLIAGVLWWIQLAQGAAFNFFEAFAVSAAAIGTPIFLSFLVAGFGYALRLFALYVASRSQLAA